MKKLIAMALAGGLVAAPLAMAKGSFEDAERVLQAASEYGITEFRSIEFDDDDHDPIEVEGWVDSAWSVELDMSADGTIGREQRRQSKGEPFGLTADEVRSYLQAAREQGMHVVEDFSVNSRGDVEVEGEDQNGRDLEVDFRGGDLTPVKVDLND